MVRWAVTKCLLATSLAGAAVAAPHGGGPDVAAAVAPKQLRQQGVPAWCAYVPRSVGLSACSGGDSGDTGTAAAPSWPKECEGMPTELRATSPACSYTEERALEMAYLSAASYCDGVQAWDCGAACDAVTGVHGVRRVDDDALGAHAVAGRLDGGQCFLAFRGTDSLSGWVQDLASVEVVDMPNCTEDGHACGVGRGFLEDWRALRPSVLDALLAANCSKAQPLAVTGHSLGGALATLALFDLAEDGHTIWEAYTFGQPRVGDDAFAAEFHRRLHGVPVYRVAKADDPVVYMPARDPFHHIGREVHYLKGAPGGSFSVCDGTGENPQCQGGPADVDVSAMLAQCLVPEDCGHLTYLRPEMHVLLDGGSCADGGSSVSVQPQSVMVP